MDRRRSAALAAALGGLLATVGSGACKGDDAAAPPPADAGRAVDPEVSRGGSGIGAGQPPSPAASEEPDGPIAVEAAPAGRGEEAVLREAAALSAWSAVLERGRLLGRRGERGAAWGRVVAGPGDAAWLVDESEAGAGLGIRLAGAGGRDLEAKPGARVLAWGAWAAEGDGEKHWVWQVDRLVGLPAAASSAASGSGSAASPAAASAEGVAASLLPSGRVGELAAAPADALPPSQRTASGMLLFTVVAAPAKPGDGWSVADAARQPAAALLVLPGEAAVYGGLDYLAPEERWSLQPGGWYAVPVAAPGKPPRAGELPVLRAQAAPSRVPPPPPPAKPARRR